MSVPPRNDDEQELTALETAVALGMAAPAAGIVGAAGVDLVRQIAQADLANAPLLYLSGNATRYSQHGKPWYAQSANELRQTKGRRTPGTAAAAIVEKR